MLEDGDIKLTSLQKRELAAHEAVPEGHIVLRGHVTDISKAVLWRRLGLRSFAKDSQSPVSPKTGVKLMQPRPSSDSEYDALFEDCYGQWQDALPANTRGRSLDFMGIEQYRTYSLGNSFYAMGRNFYMSPGNDRAIISALVSIPPDFRAALHANDMLLSMAAKTLADVPYVREGDNELRLSRPAMESYF